MESFSSVYFIIKRFLNLCWIAVSAFTQFKMSPPVRLRIFFERAGGAFIKLGQILSLRQDFVPLHYRYELVKLLSGNAPVSFAEIHKIFVTDMGTTIGEYFADFDMTPIAVGSIAQIYSAHLKTGERVAVKIQKPNLEVVFENDFGIASFFAGFIGFFKPSLSGYLDEAVSEFISWTKKELDFTYEGKNADIVYKHSKEHPKTIIPKQYLEISTPRVLIQEFMEGGVRVEDVLAGKISEEEIKLMAIDRGVMASYLIKDEMRQYFIDGFFHADPHPANLFLMPENKLAFVDFGIVGEAEAESRVMLLKFLHGVSERDVAAAGKALFGFATMAMEDEISLFIQSNPQKRLTAEKVFAKIKELILKDFIKELGGLLRPWFDALDRKDATYYEKSASVTLFNIIAKSGKYGIHLPRETILFFRGLSILDMLSLQLSPEFDMIKAIKSFFAVHSMEQVEEIVLKGNHAEAVGGKIISTADTDWEFFQETAILEKERMHLAREKVWDMIEYYAEKYEEVRSMIKSL